MYRIEIAAVGLLGLGFCGCNIEFPDTGAKARTGAVGVTTEDVQEMGRPVAQPAAQPPAQPVAQPEAKQGIIGKTTDNIGKFDPNARQDVSNQKIQATNPITAPIVAYGPMVERISIAEMDHAVRLFHASEGRYPKDYDEFMERIVKENRIKLPVLPFGGKYQYDEANHTLQVVRPPQGQKP